MPDDSSATAYPIVIAEWQRNSREIIRIALDQYKGRDIVDARAWWRNEDGNWRPGRNGLTLSLKHLPSLAEGLGDAVRRARQLGIIEGVEYRLGTGFAVLDEALDGTAQGGRHRSGARRLGSDRGGLPVVQSLGR